MATVAPSTMAIRPVPMPTATPHSRTSCQIWLMNSEAPRPAMMMDNAASTTRRTPNLFIKAAAKGPIKPNSAKRMARAADTSSRRQPNSFSSGLMKTPGAPTAPAVTSMTRNVTPTTTQP